MLRAAPGHRPPHGQHPGRGPGRALRAAGEAALKALRAVLGSEASDLDSLVSALAYARLLARESEGRAEAGTETLPVLNLPRADLPLHPETVWLFGEAGVDAAALVFRDELDLAGAHAGERLRLVLVDHNRLCPSQSAWAPAVEEIVDHHADEGLYPRARRRIAPVGSCATLVAERLFAVAPDLVDRTAGLLLLGAILLDTVDLDPGAGRVTPRDREAAARLLSIAGADRRALFERLQAGRFDVSGLGTRDILRRDCKEVQEGGLRCAVCSAPLPLRDWARRDPGLEASFRAFAWERGLGLLLVLGAYVRPEYRRELAVFSEDRFRREEVVGFLQGLGLGLTPLGLPLGELATFSQADLRASRKTILPPLQAHLREP